jgi:V/A-type H+/Na+-transporting ATPase subunit I
MQRVAVLGLREERPRVVSILYDLGAVQIEPLSKSSIQFLRPDMDNVSVREVSEELLRIRALKAALPEGVRQKRGFASVGELMVTAESIKIDDEVTLLKHDEDRLNSKLDELKESIDLVNRLSFVNEDLSIFDLESATSFFGSFEPDRYEQLRSALVSMQNVIVYSSGRTKGKDKDLVSLVVVVPNESLDKFGSIIQKADLRLQRVPKLKGRPSDVLSRLTGEKAGAETELKRVTEKLRALSDRYYAIISSVEEQLSIEARKLEVINNFGFTDTMFVLEGWVPEHRLHELEEVLKRHSVSTILFKINADGERPPTLLEAPKRLRFFQSFIRFYSMPLQWEIDPTLIFAVTFPIFFGLMLGDVGYGIVVLAISFWILRRVRSPGGKTIVPKILRSFARRIFRPTQFQKLAMAMIPGSIIGIVLGFAFNEYFGFHFNQYLFTYLNTQFNVGLPTGGAFLDPISPGGLKQLLLFSGYVGLFEVSFGLVLGMLNGYWSGEKKHVLGRLGWLLTAWGISLLGLAALHHQVLNPASNPVAGVYIGLIIAGLGLVGFGEGGQALMEIPSIVSHILSYTRLVGILLASVALALVINTLFLGDLGTGIAFAIVGVVILVFGQLFNIILALFEPGVQGARLIYVEFFSKFFHGQGKAFAPFRGGRTYTLNEIELMESSQAKRKS